MLAIHGCLFIASLKQILKIERDVLSRTVNLYWKLYTTKQKWASKKHFLLYYGYAEEDRKLINNLKNIYFCSILAN